MKLTLLEIACLLCANPDAVCRYGLGRENKSLSVADTQHWFPCSAFTDRYKDEYWSGAYATGAHFDSREIKPGDLFFCTRGEHFDGHDFAVQAAKAGAIAIIAEQDPFLELAKTMDEAEKQCLPVVFLVESTLAALWRLAATHRQSTTARVIGVTGTAGKTSVKEVLAHVLSECGVTCRNPVNRNNSIGLPISILQASVDASFWVMEAGISETHDMDLLGKILRPDMAVIINVGTGHTQGLGGKGVAHYKARLLDYVQPGGCCFVSADYSDLDGELEHRHEYFLSNAVQVRRFSISHGKEVPVAAAYLGLAEKNKGTYSVRLSDREIEVVAPFTGKHGAENVAVICGIAECLGVPLDSIISGLASVVLPEQRFSVEYLNGFTIVDDSYNSNPLSAARMLESVKEIAEKANFPLYLVMGEMGELGQEAESAHELLGSQLAQSGAEIIFWKGEQKKAILQGLQTAEFSGAFYPVSGNQEFTALLEEYQLPAGVIFFKGSRFNKMERLVVAFKDFTAS